MPKIPFLSVTYSTWTLHADINPGHRYTHYLLTDCLNLLFFPWGFPFQPLWAPTYRRRLGSGLTFGLPLSHHLQGVSWPKYCLPILQFIGVEFPADQPYSSYRPPPPLQHCAVWAHSVVQCLTFLCIFKHYYSLLSVLSYTYVTTVCPTQAVLGVVTGFGWLTPSLHTPFFLVNTEVCWIKFTLCLSFI